MQRYRVNYKLFVGLIVAVAVAAGAVFGARQYNVSRNADTLLERANKAEAAEDLGEAISLLESYTEFRKGDTEAQVRLAHNYIKLTQETMTKEKEGNPRHYRTRASTLLARNPDDSQLRRALVDLDLKYSFVRYDEFNKETLSHIKILLNDSPEDIELIEGLALCLWFQKQPQQAAAELDKLIGYDPKTGEFDSSKALAPDRLEAYSYYSQIAYLPQGATLASLNQQRLARAVLDQMVTANPDNAKAYLTRGVWFSRYDRGPDDARYDFEALARQDLLKAVELDPQNADAMNAVAEHFLKLGREALISAEEARQRAQVDTHQEQKEKAERLLDTARDYYEQGRKLEPKAPQFYVRLAALERVRGNKEKGKEIIDQALRQLDGEAKTTVLFSQADYMIDDRELDEANKLLRQLEGTLRGHPRLLSLQGKFAIQKGDWRGARETFKELLPRLMSDSDLKVQTLLGLALCHQKLAEPELARKCYEQVLEIDPENQMAMQLVSGGSRSVARANPQRQSTTGAGGDVTQATIVDGMTAEAKKPESEQNWAPFEQYIKNRAEIENLSPTRVKMAMSELARFRKKYDEAEKLLSEALKEADTDPESSEQTDVLLAAINLAAVNPNRGPAEAIKMMDTLVARFGDSPMFNIQRVRLLGALNDDTMVEKILEISRQTEGWEKREVDTLWAVIASVFEQTRHPEEAEMALKKLVELREGDLPIRIRLFKSALARNDNQGMQEAQEEILKIVGSKKDSNWAFTEAARLFATGAAGSEQTQDEVNRLLTAILRERGDWHEPYLLRAKLKLVKNDPQGALEDFTKGLSLGQGTLIDLRAYSQLLIAQNRWSDIVELVEPYPLDARIFILGENYARALFINERYTDSMEAAERTLAMANPATAELQLWYAQFLDSIIAVPAEKIPADERARFTDMQQQCREKQKLAIDEAIAMRPDSPGVWLAKVRHRLLTQKIGEAIATTQEAQLVMEEDVEPLLMAECYTSLGRWFDAENAYLALREKNPDNTTLARQLGEFYLSQMYPRPDKIDKASRLINMVLEKTAQDRSSVPEVDAQWARRAAARVLAAKGDYQSLLNAEKLLASNSDKGVLPVADKLEMASILAPRPEQVSKLKAIQLLEEVKHQASLDLKQELLLANLYFQTDNWRDARVAMDRLSGQFPKSREVRDLYVRMLMMRNRPNERQALEIQLRQLRSIDPDSLATLELTAKAADQAGQTKAAHDMLRKLVPADFSNLDPRTTAMVVRVAQLLTELKDYEGAESIYTRLSSREGSTPVQKGVLAQFVGTHRDPAAGFEMLENLQHDLPPVMLVESAIQIVTAHRDQIGEGYDERVERWLSRSLRDDPESIELILKQAAFRDLQGKYDQTEEIYRKLLDRSDVVGPIRAVVLNNLSYMIGLGVVEPKQPNEAAELINEAVRLLGPRSDILDTRAVIYMKRQDFKSAVEDLRLAVIDLPTDSKFFHLALAHLGLGQVTQAKEAWNQGVRHGLTRDSVNKLEQSDYDRAEAKLKEI